MKVLFSCELFHEYPHPHLIIQNNASWAVTRKATSSWNDTSHYLYAITARMFSHRICKLMCGIATNTASNVVTMCCRHLCDMEIEVYWYIDVVPKHICLRLCNLIFNSGFWLNAKKWFYYGMLQVHPLIWTTQDHNEPYCSRWGTGGKFVSVSRDNRSSYKITAFVPRCSFGGGEKGFISASQPAVTGEPSKSPSNV